MSFISVEHFDENGEFKVFKSQRRVLEEIDEQDNGIIKGKARVKNEYVTLDQTDIVPVDNLLEAEKMALEEFEIFYSISTPPLNHIPQENWLAHRISTAAANIATMSKRGFGNTVICHPSLRSQVDACWDKTKTVQEFDPNTEEMIEREKPYFPAGAYEVFEHPDADTQSVLVMYRGETPQDQPLIYIENHGLLLNNRIADVEFYGKFVKV